MRVSCLVALFLALVCAKTILPPTPELLEQIIATYPSVHTLSEAKTLLAVFNSMDEDDGIDRLPGGLILPFECGLDNETFACGTEEAEPTCVHDLRVCNIGATGAIGDSITAGFGATASSILGVFTEARGVSWSIGGEKSLSDGVLTLPNLLEQYGDHLVGFSTGNGKQDSSNAHANQAVTGAIAEDLGGQAKLLVDKLRSGLGDNFEQTWKIVTIFIGGNDLCDVCKDENKHSADAYEAGVDEALQYLKENSPRTFVNLVPTVDVGELSVIGGFTCSLVHAYACDCAKERALVRNYQEQYYQRADALQAKYNAECPSDFTVVVQPFMYNTTVPMKDGSPDKSFFAPDCFHFSEKGHQAAAVALWNNMNERVGAKDMAWEGPKEYIHCPKPTDYLWTVRNSA